MGQDNQPKHRQLAKDLRRREASRKPIDRLLIVCEGTKTEPNYLNEIRQEFRLSTANVHVLPGGFGTQPIQIVEYAEHLFLKGDPAKGIEPRIFDQIFAVFDRDEHGTYHAALAKATSLDGRLTSDLKARVPFRAIASVPCFEYWLLIHFEEITAPIHRDDVCARLHAHLPGYQKGQEGHWEQTKHQLHNAVQRAQARSAATNHHNGNDPCTDMHELVSILVQLKDQS